jgi:hypothetical protein
MEPFGLIPLAKAMLGTPVRIREGGIGKAS